MADSLEKTPQKLADELCNACERGLNDKVDTLLKLENVQDFINLKDKKGFTALLWASNGKDALVTALLKSGADIEARDNEGFTPLITAASDDGNVACVQILLEAGANVEAVDNTGNDALFYAKHNVEKKKLIEERMPNKLKNINEEKSKNRPNKEKKSCVIL